MARSAFWEFYSRGHVPLLLSVWSWQRLLRPNGKLQVRDTHGSIWVHLREGVLRERSTVWVHRWVSGRTLSVSCCVKSDPQTQWLKPLSSYCSWVNWAAPLVSACWHAFVTSGELCRILAEFSYLFGHQLAGVWSKMTLSRTPRWPFTWPLSWVCSCGGRVPERKSGRLQRPSRPGCRTGRGGLGVSCLLSVNSQIYPLGS